MTYIKPSLKAKIFTCPHCHAIAQHEWKDIGFPEDQSAYIKNEGIWASDTMIAMCLACQGKTLWYQDKLLYPAESAPEPNPDMPTNVLTIYNEAGEIYTKSPRAACALLRLAIEQLCNELVEEDTIDKNIAKLVKEGLPQKIQQALDLVRVIGNKAVHPGQIELDVDNIDTAKTLFNLLNIITSSMITEKNQISDLFNMLPESTKKAIERRDK
ncbi:DUF4145 domain-containing protein [uncultured Alistipes sp.]|uniref:DUF4145 domain-containing protein n=1 Tax=uncultured Alistipes sp. TaxID=538949 RepID=UPI00266D7592|nr:DUF4145 domain-containing protein [uncultured Alistipes sp.]